MAEPHETRQIRCPRLGHEIAFSYCEREGGDLPCPRIIRCWQPFLPVEAYLKRTLSPDAWERFSSPATGDKMTSLLEMIELAKRVRKERP